MVWEHSGQPILRKFKQTYCGRKLLFLGTKKGVLLVVFINPGATITSEAYCETLKQLMRAIQNS